MGKEQSDVPGVGEDNRDNSFGSRGDTNKGSKSGRGKGGNRLRAAAC